MPYILIFRDHNCSGMSHWVLSWWKTIFRRRFSCKSRFKQSNEDASGTPMIVLPIFQIIDKNFSLTITKIVASTLQAKETTFSFLSGDSSEVKMYNMIFSLAKVLWFRWNSWTAEFNSNECSVRSKNPKWMKIRMIYSRRFKLLKSTLDIHQDFSNQPTYETYVDFSVLCSRIKLFKHKDLYNCFYFLSFKC